MLIYIYIFKILTVLIENTGIFLQVRTRGNGFKLKESRLARKEKFFTVRAVRHWTRFLREAVVAPSLAVFKAGLDGALSDLA